MCWYTTLELMTLFVNRVFRISALWFVSQMHEKANLGGKKKIIDCNLFISSTVVKKNISTDSTDCCVCVLVVPTCPRPIAKNKDWS